MGRSCYCCDKKDTGPCDLCVDLSETSFIKKATISIKGFQDYNFDETYSNEFFSDINPFVGAPDNAFLMGWSYDRLRYDPGSYFKGFASFRYVLNIQGLNNLNTHMQFDLVGNKFIPKEFVKFLGEVTVTTLVEHSMSGKGYAFFPKNNQENCLQPCDATEPCGEPPWPRIENCVWYIRNELYDDMRETDIPSDWNGKLGVVYKYDFYLVSEEYSCNLGKNKSRLESPTEINICETDSLCFIDDTCNRHLNHMIFENGNINPRITPAVRLVAVLKETEIIEDGVYKNTGYYPEFEEFDTCYQKRGGGGLDTNCPIIGQSPCSGTVIKAKLPCRNPLYINAGINFLGIPVYRLHHDISERIFFPNGCEGGRCFQICGCEGFGPPLPPGFCPPSGQSYKYWSKCRIFENHYNFYPFGGLGGFLHREIINFDNCDISSLPNLTKNYFFQGKIHPLDEIKYSPDTNNLCYPDYDDPCLFCSSYNDATKKIKQKYRVFSPISYLGYNNQLINFQNNTNYLKIFSPCDSKTYPQCDFSTTTGAGITPFTDIVGISRSTNFLDFVFTKILPWNTSQFNFGSENKIPDPNSNCWNYILYIPFPLNGFWGSSELEFIKVKDQIGSIFNPDFKLIYWPTPDNKYCNKTFFNHPNLNWSATGKNNENEIIIGLVLKTYSFQRPFFTLPIPPETVLEAEYE